MSGLIERIEAAGEGSRKIDGDIAVDVKSVPPFVSHRDSPEWASWSGGRDYWDAPHYTTSVDAALTLVPEGFDWTLGHTNGGLTIHAEVGGRGDEYMRFGATPALALCAAALRARETTPSIKGGA